MNMTNKSKQDLIKKILELEEQINQKAGIEKKLTKTTKESQARHKELSVFLEGARTVLTQKGFSETARAIFDLCRDLIGASSGYVALLNEAGDENEVLFLEAGGLPCDVDPELPMPIRGLRSVAYKENRTVYENDFMKTDWEKFMPQGHVVLINVLFAPLIIEGTTVGIMGLANKETDFNIDDARIATGFGELAAIALQNSRFLDQRNQADQERDQVIEELKTALTQVKKLSGLLPICSCCKKVRDDRGYWNQIESYIRDHSEADFSHSLCPECVKNYI